MLAPPCRPFLPLRRRQSTLTLNAGRSSSYRWRGGFVAKCLERLLDEPRPGAPRRVGGAEVEGVLTRTLESTPSNATHWSTRLLARRWGMSQCAVSRQNDGTPQTLGSWGCDHLEGVSSGTVLGLTACGTVSFHKPAELCRRLRPVIREIAESKNRGLFQPGFSSCSLLSFSTNLAVAVYQQLRPAHADQPERPRTYTRGRRNSYSSGGQ